MDESWFPGHMAKAYHRIKETIKIIDLLFEVRDARAPVASSNPSLLKLADNKKIIIIFNKEDLAEPEETRRWVEHLSSQGKKVFSVNCLNNKSKNPILKYLQKLLEEKKGFLKSRGRKDATLRVITAGIPNVGKSSFINLLSKKGKVKVGRKAGITRGEQWLKISEGIELLDTPGILPFSNKEEFYWKLALIGALSREKIIPERVLQEYYSHFPDALIWEKSSSLFNFLQKKGTSYSYLTSGGKIDIERTARRFLQELEIGSSNNSITLETID